MNFFIKSRMVLLCVPIVKRAIAGTVLQIGAGKCGTSHGAEFFVGKIVLHTKSMGC